MRTPVRLRVVLALLAASGAAVVDRATGFTGVLPRTVTRALAWFLEPGVTVWWCTLGGFFEGFPSDGAGYALVVVANAGCWLVMVLLTARLVEWGRRTAGGMTTTTRR